MAESPGAGRGDLESKEETEYYSIYPKDEYAISEDEVDRLIVVAQNSLAELRSNEAGPRFRAAFPDNFQAREFRTKLKNYYPNWQMRKISKAGFLRNSKEEGLPEPDRGTS